MFCVYTEVMAQDDNLLLNNTTSHFQLFLCLRLTSPNYAFMNPLFRIQQNNNIKTSSR